MVELDQKEFYQKHDLHHKNTYHMMTHKVLKMKLLLTGKKMIQVLVIQVYKLVEEADMIVKVLPDFL